MLTQAGAAFDLRHAGYYAINAMRLEKGYRAFGTELNPDYNPAEAGLLFTTKLKSTIAFLGRQALERARSSGVRRRLVSFVLEDPDVMMWGGELMLHNGVGTGQVTSAALGSSIGSCVGLGYVWMPDGSVIDEARFADQSWSINVSGRVIPAAVSLAAPFDPTSSRIRN